MTNHTTETNLPKEKKEQKPKNVFRFRKTSHFVTINYLPIHSAELSCVAKALWTFGLSHPPDWTFYFSEISKHFKEGQRSLYNGFNELIEQGYAARFPYHMQMPNTKRWVFCGNEYVFFDKKMSDIEIQEVREEFKKCFQDRRFLHAQIEDAQKRTLLRSTNILEQDSIVNGSPKADPIPSPLLPNFKKNVLRSQKQDTAKEKREGNPLTDHFFQKLKEMNPKILLPRLQIWDKEIDRMMRIDGRSEGEIRKVIDYIVFQHHNPKKDFTWSKAVSSPEKLRKHFAAIWLEMNTKTPEKAKEGVEDQKIKLIKENKQWSFNLKNKLSNRMPEHIAFILNPHSIVLTNRNTGSRQEIGYSETAFRTMGENFFRKNGIV